MKRPYNWYRDRGFLEAAKHDEATDVRVKYYESTGWTDDALLDESGRVRRLAYERMGWRESALTDADAHIRYLAEYRVAHGQKLLPDGARRNNKYSKVTLENAPKYLVGKDEMLKDYATLILKFGLPH